VAKKYPLETVERGLQLLAVLGSDTLAARMLKEEGHPVPRETLRDWRDKHHTERYVAICAQEAPKIRERMAAENEAIADKLIRLEHQMADRLVAQADNLEPKDLSNALRNASVSKAVATDKAQSLRDRPTAVIEHKLSIQDIDSERARIARALEQLGVIESTATEIEAPALEATTGD
jgi:hypothetical protein